MRLELWAGIGHARPGGQANVGNARPARACKEGGDLHISSVKRFH